MQKKASKRERILASRFCAILKQTHSFDLVVSYELMRSHFCVFQFVIQLIAVSEDDERK